MANPRPLILASASQARRDMLEKAGLDFTVQPSDFDEQAMIDQMLAQQNPLGEIALALSAEKAKTVAQQNPEALVIGADQVLDFDGQLMTKAADEKQAREKLMALRGHAHKLISAVSIVRGAEILWQHSDEAILTMHDFDDDFLDDFLDEYCAKAGVALTRAVGAYELESHGAWLFKGVQGDFFTVLGLPLLPLLGYLREHHGCGP